MFGYPVQQLLALTTQAVPEALSSASIDLIAKPSLFGPSNSSSNLQEIEPQRQEMNDALSEGTMIEGKPASAARNRTTRCRNCRLARAASRASGAGHTQGSGTADSHQSEAICRKRHKNALPSIVKAGTIRVMTDDERLRQMIDELRRMREQCEPKSNQNPRYLRYSNAVSALRWIIEDLAKERARNKRT